MKGVKGVIGVIFLVLMLSGSFSPGGWDSQFKYASLLTAPSYIPPEEAYTHIGGGFFSVFDSRMGTFNKGAGAVIMQLKKLYHSSLFVYRPKGDLVLRFSNGDSWCFSMEKLDYVASEDNGIPLYRIRLFPQEGCHSDVLMACFIGSATAESSPKLEGELYILRTNSPWEVMDIRIAGRNELRADNHLYKVVAAVTEL